MKLSLRGDRASSAVPALPPTLASRFGAWARHSLAARALAIVAGLVLLAAIGSSAALAGGGSSQAPTVTPSPSAAPSPSPATDAGVVPAIHVASPPLSPPEITERGVPPARATPESPVDLNAARQDDLRRLPGIGPKRAEAILALRARLPGSRFQQIEDLLKVKGIGRAMLRRLRPLVRIDARSAPDPGPPRG